MGEDLKDQEILNLALEDPSYFSILVDRYQVPFIRKAMGIVHTSEEAEDIVQETFTKIYRYAHKFKKQKGIEFKSWAYKIVFNTAFTHYRKAKKRWGETEYLDTLLYDVLKGKDIEAEITSGILVKETFEKMPTDAKELLELHYLKELSYEEISRQKNMTIPALKMRLFRARDLFRRLIQGKELNFKNENYE